VAVVKLHKHAVRTGCKDTTLALEQNVLNFLANTQEGHEVKVPNVRDWANRALDGIEQNKEYYDARMSSRKVIPKTLPRVHPESQKQPQVVTINPIDPPKQVQAFDQGRNMVPGKCLKCQADIMGPPHDRGGDNARTWHKFCNECHASVRRAGGKYKSETRSIQQVEEVNEDRHEPDGVFGPCDYNGTNGCSMVNVHRSEQEQVTTKVLIVLTYGRPNKGIVDSGVIVDSGAAVTLTNSGSG
jgi:hypothetical protein